MFLDHVVDAKKDKDYEIAQNFFLQPFKNELDPDKIEAAIFDSQMNPTIPTHTKRDL